MSFRQLFLLAASAVLLPGEATAQLGSGYQDERAVVGPGGASVTLRSSVAGPFGTTTRVSRSGSYVTPSGGTVEYAERSGAVVGPLGYGRASTASYYHAENADRSLTYSRYSRSRSAVGPVGGVLVGRTT